MWYGVSIFMKGDGSQAGNNELLWEEKVVVIQASSEKEARTKAIELGKDGECKYISVTNQLINWKFACIQSVYEIEGSDINPGTEVFSRFLRATEVESLLKPFE